MADDPNRIVIPEQKSTERFVQSLSYVVENVTVYSGSRSLPLFGGNQTWKQRDESFKVKPSMKVRNRFLSIEHSFCILYNSNISWNRTVMDT